MNNLAPPIPFFLIMNWWWKFIWQLHLQPKIWIFMWKASRDCIPTTTNLQSHHDPTNRICPLCKIEYDTTSHCLLFFPFVRNAWEKTFFWNFVQPSAYIFCWMWDVLIKAFEEKWILNVCYIIMGCQEWILLVGALYYSIAEGYQCGLGNIFYGFFSKCKSNV